MGRFTVIQILLFSVGVSLSLRANTAVGSDNAIGHNDFSNLECQYLDQYSTNPVPLPLDEEIWFEVENPLATAYHLDLLVSDDDLVEVPSLQQMELDQMLPHDVGVGVGPTRIYFELSSSIFFHGQTGVLQVTAWSAQNINRQYACIPVKLVETQMLANQCLENLSDGDFSIGWLEDCALGGGIFLPVGGTDVGSDFQTGRVDGAPYDVWPSSQDGHDSVSDSIEVGVSGTGSAAARDQLSAVSSVGGCSVSGKTFLENYFLWILLSCFLILSLRKQRSAA